MTGLGSESQFAEILVSLVDALRSLAFCVLVLEVVVDQIKVPFFITSHEIHEGLEVIAKLGGIAPPMIGTVMLVEEGSGDVFGPQDSRKGCCVIIELNKCFLSPDEH